MRILQISNAVTKISVDRAGGAERTVFFLSKHLSQLGHEVTLLDRKYSPDDPPFEQTEGINIVRLSAKHFSPLPTALGEKFPFLNWIRNGLNRSLFFFKVNHYLKQRESEFHAIHAHWIGGIFLLLISNKSLKEKIFYTHHENYWPLQFGGMLNRLLLPIRSFALKRVKRIIVQNDLARSDFVRHLKLPEQKVVVLPAGININLPRLDTELNDIKAKYQLNGRRVILFVGRVSKEKGIEYLIKAANTLVNQFNYKDALFLVVGPFEGTEIDKPGTYTASILSLIESFKLKDSAKLTGAVPLDDLNKLYLACNIFVLPSFVEQFPAVVMEAMASGKPVVATKTQGALAQVRDGWNGFLVEIGNEKELAEKIRHLLDNPDEAKQMGTNAREFAKNFEWPDVAKEYLAVYQA